MLQIALQNDEGYRGNLSLNNKVIKKFSPLKPTRICITNLYSAERRRVERFIEQTFRNSYGAEISHHYPALMSVHDEDDNILAALGFRYAKDENLFLETYLDEAIEDSVSKAYSHEIKRENIAEIGNLASKGQGASIFLFTAINAYLFSQGIEINTVTATDFLARYFCTLGLKATELAKADQTRLADEGVSWGSYYNENPRVISGYVEQVLGRLSKHLQVVLETEDTQMHARIHGKHISEDFVI